VPEVEASILVRLVPIASGAAAPKKMCEGAAISCGDCQRFHVMSNFKSRIQSCTELIGTETTAAVVLPASDAVVACSSFDLFIMACDYFQVPVH
jgi:hypothetical protein